MCDATITYGVHSGESEKAGDMLLMWVHLPKSVGIKLQKNKLALL